MVNVAERVPTTERSREGEAQAAGFASVEQAQAARTLAEIFQAHKAIDVALAERAKATLRETVLSGREIDMNVFRGLVAEAEQRYAVADKERAARVVPKEEVAATQIFRVPPRRQEMQVPPPREVAPERKNDDAQWEAWRAHLVHIGAIDETGTVKHAPDALRTLGLDDAQVAHIARLQTARYWDGKRSASEVPARVVDRAKNEHAGESPRVVMLRNSIAVETLRRDALAQKAAAAAGNEAKRIAEELAQANTYLARLEDQLRAA